MTRSNRTADRAVIVGLASGAVGRAEAERRLDELAGLVRAAGATVAWRLVQERPHPDPATLIGAGKVQTLRALCDELGADLVVVDNELSPAQLRNLDKSLERKVVDRTQLILDIFAGRARTREGKLQVELAQLKYLLPRLVGSSAALSRLGGGIGTRGPGETKLETDRRRIRDRVRSLTEGIAAVKRRRGQLRDRRRQGPRPSVALVGYTNAGKTTLFNRLAKASGVASDALFVTLDPLIREVRLSDTASILLSDTVGFIDRLPHTLVAAFRATLEEVAEADLLLHVVDASSADVDRQIAAVHTVLDEVSAGHVPAIVVLNKCDAAAFDDLARLRARYPSAPVISGLNGDGIDELVDTISARLGLDAARVRLSLANDEAGQAVLSRLYRHARVLSQDHDGDRLAIEADVPRRYLSQLAPLLAGDARG
ncbi:MAG: GTPase HflX [Vicinamibacterales bacterium]